MSAFYAAQNLLGAKALYSDLTISHLLDPAYFSTRAALETHHIFPKAHLQALGLPEQERNQNRISDVAYDSIVCHYPLLSVVKAVQKQM